MFRFPAAFTSMHRFPCGPLTDAATRWFRYTPQKSDPTSGFSLASPPGDDWVIEIFSGACGSLVSLGCSNGGPGDTPISRVSFNGVAGQTYVLAVGRISGVSTTNPQIDLTD